MVVSIFGFNLFLGGACGRSINAALMKVQGAEVVFRNSSFFFLAAVFVARFEMRKRQQTYSCAIN
ncbi:hypothetical protein [Pontiella sulfatireligans]|uniref:Uncharacterized protein n=1 Tax=Pontiella sulfatireligans TaxID=2750658 RepID=A0A6C2UST4_9BACT|nr:hypothetical protein [Pontiella sulfatireligans]VGO23400.1 hypothetical protein SCARR_05507 [Pontiella sulfatireligans]